jgi:alpha-mannosidase
MSQPTEPAPDLSAQTTPVPEDSDSRSLIRSLRTLVPIDRIEPPADLDEADAQGIWAAISAPWHPAVLAQLDSVPSVDPATGPSEAVAGRIFVIAHGSESAVPSGFATQAADAGAGWVSGTPERIELVLSILGRLSDQSHPESPALDDPLATDYMALGAARWWLRDVAIAMGHTDSLDETLFGREVLTGARAWRQGDAATATTRLRAAFELLTQARERFYPVDAYLIDLCLADSTTPPDAWLEPLQAHAPVTFVAPGAAIEAVASQSPEVIALLRQAVEEGWADVAGGPYLETDETLRPLGSVLWQYHRGARAYRAAIDDRTVETFARRRFGLHPILPQIARRFGMKYAVHLSLDGARFPARVDTKRLWTSPDGAFLEALVRPPLPADRWTTGLVLPWRVGRTMRDDHVATLVLAHWPGSFAGWLGDLRRIAAYSPVFVRWTTLADYFHLTDRPYDTLRPKLDEYLTPYLAQIIERGDPEPISRRVSRFALRGRFESLSTLDALLHALDPERAANDPQSSLAAAEDDLETGRLKSAESTVGRLETDLAAYADRELSSDADVSKPGHLVLNLACVDRVVPVLAPELPPNLPAEHPLRAVQWTDTGSWALVDVPALGYAWFPSEVAAVTAEPAGPKPKIGTRENTLFNGLMEVEFDPNTGGIRAVRADGESLPRLGQQLVMSGVYDIEGRPATSRMQCDKIEIEFGGPALAQATSRGVLLDPLGGHALATFRQTFRLWAARPVLELEVELSELDVAWLAHANYGDPWDHALSCRFAWPESAEIQKRVSFLCTFETSAQRPETPEAFEICHRRGKTTLVFAGLAHHRRHGSRMLDTLLLAGRETARTFVLRIALDVEHPHTVVLDSAQPVLCVPSMGPPAKGISGRFLEIDHPSVALVGARWEQPNPPEVPSALLVLDLIETSGQAARARLRLPFTPQTVNIIDFQGEPVAEFTPERDWVTLDFTPNELMRVAVPSP